MQIVHAALSAQMGTLRTLRMLDQRGKQLRTAAGTIDAPDPQAQNTLAAKVCRELQ